MPANVTPSVPPSCCAVGSRPETEVTASARTLAVTCVKAEAVNTPKAIPPRHSADHRSGRVCSSPMVAATTTQTSAIVTADAGRIHDPNRLSRAFATPLPTRAPTA